MEQLRKAQRNQAKINLAFQGSAGYRKAMSALLRASGMTNDWNKITVIGTETHSAGSMPIGEIIMFCHSPNPSLLKGILKLMKHVRLVVLKSHHH